MRDLGDSWSFAGMARAKNDQQAEERRKVFRAFMDARGLTPYSWATLAGERKLANAIYNFLNGSSASLHQKTLEQLAKPLGISSAAIFGELEESSGEFRTLLVRGDVQAGAWSEIGEWPTKMGQRRATVPALEGSRQTASYGLIVRGASMNKLYPPGTLLEVVDLPAYDGGLKNGDKVIVIRRDRNGLYEATCKELQFENNKVWLWPRSTDPEFQQPISLPWPTVEDDTARDDGIEHIEIKAVVITSIRSEV